MPVEYPNPNNALVKQMAGPEMWAKLMMVLILRDGDEKEYEHSKGRVRCREVSLGLADIERMLSAFPGDVPSIAISTTNSGTLQERTVYRVMSTKDAKQFAEDRGLLPMEGAPRPVSNDPGDAV